MGAVSVPFADGSADVGAAPVALSVVDGVAIPLLDRAVPRFAVPLTEFGMILLIVPLVGLLAVRFTVFFLSAIFLGLNETPLRCLALDPAPVATPVITFSIVPPSAFQVPVVQLDHRDV